jgi:hypothetical protein
MEYGVEPQKNSQIFPCQRQISTLKRELSWDDKFLNGPYSSEVWVAKQSSYSPPFWRAKLR